MGVTAMTRHSGPRRWSDPHLFHMIPAVFLFTFSFALFNPSLTILMVERACEELSAENCNEANVTGYTSKWMFYAATVNSVIPALAAGTLGTLSDKYGRKLTLLVPCVGNAVQAIIILCFAYFKMSFWWIVFGGFISGISGGSGTMFCGFFSYVADISKGGTQRSLLFSVLAAVQDIGILFGNLAVGKFYRWWGISSPFWAVSGVYICLCLYVVMVPESLTEESRATKLDWKKVNVFGALGGIWRATKLGPPIVQVVLALTFTFAYAAFIGFVIIIVLYAKQLFYWGPTTISYFAAAQSGLRGIGVLVLAPLLFRARGGLPAWAIISSSLVFQSIAYGIYSVARSTKMMFMGTGFEGLSAVSIPTIRAIFSRASPPTEQGKVLSVVGAIETIINTLIPIAIPWLFSETNATCPRCTMYVVVGFSGLAFLISLVYGAIAKPLPGDSKRLSLKGFGGKDTKKKRSYDILSIQDGDGNNDDDDETKPVFSEDSPQPKVVPGQSCPYIQLHNDQDPIARASTVSYGTSGIHLPQS